jgi:hypothetical protein
MAENLWMEPDAVLARVEVRIRQAWANAVKEILGVFG